MIGNSDMWIISDTHFFHKNIARYAGRPDNWQEQILRSWRVKVKPDDYILHLGDVFLGNKTTAIELISSLPGRKILIKGNHDARSNKTYERMGFTLIKPFWTFYPRGEEDHFMLYFSHHPFQHTFNTPLIGRSYNLHGHIHEKDSKYRNHVNLSVEKTNYSPIKLHEVISRSCFYKHTA